VYNEILLYCEMFEKDIFSESRLNRTDVLEPVISEVAFIIKC
jgi:hypothetical protein